MDISRIDRIIELRNTIEVCKRLLTTPSSEALRKDVEREKEECERELAKLEEWLQ